MRCKLRPVNMPPELLYKQHKVPTDARPVLGRSLVTNHVLPFNINETTVKKRHDLNGRKVEVKKAVPKEHMDGN